MLAWLFLYLSICFIFSAYHTKNRPHSQPRAVKLSHLSENSDSDSDSCFQSSLSDLLILERPKNFCISEAIFIRKEKKLPS